jgi:hypothetical protein
MQKCVQLLDPHCWPEGSFTLKVPTWKKDINVLNKNGTAG